MARKRGLGKWGILKEAQQTVEEIADMLPQEKAADEDRQRAEEKLDSQPADRISPTGIKVER